MTPTTTTPESMTGRYFLASGLIGFQSSRLRVFVTRHESGLVWVRTADLLDAGTALTLNEGQLSPIGEGPEVLVAKGGLVAFI